MPIDPDVQPLLDAKADASALASKTNTSTTTALANRVTALEAEVAALKVHTHDSVPPPPPPPPTPSPPPPPPTGVDGQPTYADRGVTINPGDDIDTKIQSVPVGTVIGFAPGVHLIDTAAKQFTPRRGEVMVGATDASGVPTAIIRGNWDMTQAGVGLASPFPQGSGEAYQTDVKLMRLMIERFAPTFQQTAVLNGTRWLVHKCWIHDIKTGGYSLGPGSTIFGSKIYRCQQIGLKCGPNNTGATADSCEIFENNYNRWYDYYNEAGGMKFAADSRNMVIKKCHFHHNHGNGIWFDDCDTGGVIEDNISEYNVGSGIEYEISRSGVIRRNTVRYNGGAADIYISNAVGTAAAPVIVEDNIVYNSATLGNTTHAEIWLKDNAVGSIPRLGYVTVRRNKIARASKGAPAYSNTAIGTFGDNGAFGDTAPGIVIQDNDYYTNIPDAWMHGGGTKRKTWAQWQALGFDTTGSTAPYQIPT